MFNTLKKKVKLAEEAYAKAVENLGNAFEGKEDALIKKCQKIKRTAETKLINARTTLYDAKHSVPNFMSKTVSKIPFKKTAIWSGITVGATAVAVATWMAWDHYLGNGETDTSDEV